jgi:hypothetical protein
LSTVVTTLIIILLVLVAVGIIWVVIRGVIEQGTVSADYSVKCLSVDVRVVNVSGCSGGGPINCNVTISRNSGGETISGVKLVFYDDQMQDQENLSFLVDSPGNIDPLITATRIVSGIDIESSPEKVEIIPYFKDDSGNEQVCSQKQAFTV